MSMSHTAKHQIRAGAISSMCLIMLLVLGLSGTASAMSGLQKGLMKAGVHYFDVEETAGLCAPTSGNLVGSNNEEQAYNFFVSKGYQPYQSAGIVGNMKLESGVLPQRLQSTSATTITTAEQYKASGSSAGWGVVQWTPGSKFIDEITPIASANLLDTQLTFVWDQLEGRTTIPEKQAGDDIKGTPDIYEAVIAFQGNTTGAASPAGKHYVGYERPKDQTGSVDERTQYAIEILSLYGDGAPPTSAPVTGGSDCSTGLVNNGDYSFPTDLHWYEDTPTEFTDPHHDYPAIDIGIPQGENVYSVHAGTVFRAPIETTDTGYGQGVWIKDATYPNVEYIYGHGIDGGLAGNPKPGDTVTAGQLIMHSGTTGDSSGPHIHFEIRVDGDQVCPQSLVVAIAENQPIPDVRTLPKTGCTY